MVNSIDNEKRRQINEVLKKYYESLKTKKEIAVMLNIYYNNDVKDKKGKSISVNSFSNNGEKIYNYNNPIVKNIINDLIEIEEKYLDIPDSPAPAPGPVVKVSDSQQKNSDLQQEYPVAPGPVVQVSDSQQEDPGPVYPVPSPVLVTDPAHVESKQQELSNQNITIGERNNQDLKDLIEKYIQTSNNFKDLLLKIPSYMIDDKSGKYDKLYDKFIVDYDNLIHNFTKAVLDTLNYIGIGIKKLNINEDKIEQKFVKNVNDKVDKFHDVIEELLKYLEIDKPEKSNTEQKDILHLSDDFKRLIEDYKYSISNLENLLNKNIPFIEKYKGNNTEKVITLEKYFGNINSLKDEFIDTENKFMKYIEEIKQRQEELIKFDVTNQELLLLTDYKKKLVESVYELLKYMDTENNKIEDYQKNLSQNIDKIPGVLGILNNTNIKSLEEYKQVFLNKTNKLIDILNVKEEKSKINFKKQKSMFSINLSVQDYLNSANYFKNFIEKVYNDDTYNRINFIESLINELKELKKYINQSNNSRTKESFILNLEKYEKTNDNNIKTYISNILNEIRNSELNKVKINEQIDVLLNYLLKISKDMKKNTDLINKISTNLLKNFSNNIEKITTSSNNFKEFLNTSVKDIEMLELKSTVNTKELFDTQKQKYEIYLSTLQKFNKYINNELDVISNKLKENKTSNISKEIGTSYIFNQLQDKLENIKKKSDTFINFLNLSIDNTAKLSKTQINDPKFKEQLSKHKQQIISFDKKYAEFIDYLKTEKDKVKESQVNIDKIDKLSADLLLPFSEKIEKIKTSSNSFKGFLDTTVKNIESLQTMSKTNTAELFNNQRQKYEEYILVLQNFNIYLDNELKTSTNKTIQNDSNIKDIFKLYRENVKNIKESSNTFIKFLETFSIQMDTLSKMQTNDPKFKEQLSKHKQQIISFDKKYTEFIDYLKNEKDKIKKSQENIDKIDKIDKLSVDLLLPFSENIEKIKTSSNSFKEFLDITVKNIESLQTMSKTNTTELFNNQRQKYEEYILALQNFNIYLENELKTSTNKTIQNDSNIKDIFKLYQENVKDIKESSDTFIKFLENFSIHIDTLSKTQTDDNKFKEYLDKFKQSVKNFDEKYVLFIKILTDKISKIEESKDNIDLTNELSSKIFTSYLKNINNITETFGNFTEFMTTSVKNIDLVHDISEIDIKLFNKQKNKYKEYLIVLKNFNDYLEQEFQNLVINNSNIDTNVNTNVNTNVDKKTAKTIIETYKKYIKDIKTQSDKFINYFETSIKNVNVISEIKNNDPKFSEKIIEHKKNTINFDRQFNQFINYLTKESTKILKNKLTSVSNNIQDFNSKNLIPYLDSISKVINISDNFLKFLMNTQTNMNMIYNTPSIINNSEILKKIAFTEYIIVLDNFIEYLKNEKYSDNSDIPKLNLINIDEMEKLLNEQTQAQEQELGEKASHMFFDSIQTNKEEKNKQEQEAKRLQEQERIRKIQEEQEEKRLQEQERIRRINEYNIKKAQEKAQKEEEEKSKIQALNALEQVSMPNNKNIINRLERQQEEQLLKEKEEREKNIQEAKRLQEKERIRRIQEEKQFQEEENKRRKQEREKAIQLQDQERIRRINEYNIKKAQEKAQSNFNDSMKRISQKGIQEQIQMEKEERERQILERENKFKEEMNKIARGISNTKVKKLNPSALRLVGNVFPNSIEDIKKFNFIK